MTGQRCQREQRDLRLGITEHIGERVVGLFAAVGDQIVHRKQAHGGLAMPARHLGRVGDMAKLPSLEGTHAVEQALLAIAQCQALERPIQGGHGASGVAAQLSGARRAFPVGARLRRFGRGLGERLVAVGRSEELTASDLQLSKQDLRTIPCARIAKQFFGLATGQPFVARLPQRVGHSQASQAITRIQGSQPLPHRDRAHPVFSFDRRLPGQTQGRLVQSGGQLRGFRLDRGQPTRGQEPERDQAGEGREPRHAQAYPSRLREPRFMKKPFAIGCGLLFAVVVGGLVWLLIKLNRGIISEPAEIRAVARDILAVEAPAGLEPELAVDLFGAKFAIYQEGTNETNSLVMASIPKKAIEKAEADWKAQTQIEWDEIDANATVETSQVMMQFAGQSIEVEMAFTQTSSGSYRSFLATLEAGESVIKLFRVGDAGTVTEEHFQGLLDQASAGL